MAGQGRRGQAGHGAARHGRRGEAGHGAARQARHGKHERALKMTASELKSLRKRFKWSQKEAAIELGCSPRSIANWENGVNVIPDYIALAVSAVCLNLPKYGDLSKLK